MFAGVEALLLQGEEVIAKFCFVLYGVLWFVFLSFRKGAPLDGRSAGHVCVGHRYPIHPIG